MGRSFTIGYPVLALTSSFILCMFNVEFLLAKQLNNSYRIFNMWDHFYLGLYANLQWKGDISEGDSVAPRDGLSIPCVGESMILRHALALLAL